MSKMLTPKPSKQDALRTKRYCNQSTQVPYHFPQDYSFFSPTLQSSHLRLRRTIPYWYAHPFIKSIPKDQMLYTPIKALLSVPSIPHGYNPYTPPAPPVASFKP